MRQVAAVQKPRRKSRGAKAAAQKLRRKSRGAKAAAQQRAGEAVEGREARSVCVCVCAKRWTGRGGRASDPDPNFVDYN